MKIEIIRDPAPIKEVVLRLNEEEARYLRLLTFYNVSIPATLKKIGGLSHAEREALASGQLEKFMDAVTDHLKKEGIALPW